MKNLNQLRATLHAWETFRDVARGTRSLAATQALRWHEHRRVAEDHLAQALVLARTLGPPDVDARGSTAHAAVPRVLIAVGTDLGFCGALNRLVAEQLAPTAVPAADLRILVGQRLHDLVDDPGAIPLAAPTSLPAVELLAGQIDTLITALGHPAPHLELVGVETSEGAETLQIRRASLPRPDFAPTAPRPAVISEVESARRQAQRVLRHAWIVAGLCKAGQHEADARRRTMTQAYEGAQRGIEQQQMTLRKLQQERVTQEMLEARAGGRGGGAGLARRR